MKRFYIATAGVLIIILTAGIGYVSVTKGLSSGTNMLISTNKSNTGSSTNLGNTLAQVSENGSIVAWTSSSTDVVENDASSITKLYLKNISTNATQIIGLDLNGQAVEVNSDIGKGFSMSRTGRYIAFSSRSNNLVSNPNLPDSLRDRLYLKDTFNDTLTLIDQSQNGAPANTPAGSGTFVNSVSDDGRFITFNSTATNLLASGNPTSGTNHYLKDMQTGEILLLNRTPSGSLANAQLVGMSASCDGSLIVFSSYATNLTTGSNTDINTYLLDIRNGKKLISLTGHMNNGGGGAQISCNGRYVAMASKSTGITNHAVNGTDSHVYRYDRLEEKYELIDQSSSGYVSQSKLGGAKGVSDDGKVVFIGYDKNLITPASPFSIEAYVRNPEAGTTEPIPVDSNGIERGLGDTTSTVTSALTISADGKSILYLSKSGSLVPEDTTSKKKIIIRKYN